MHMHAAPDASKPVTNRTTVEAVCISFLLDLQYGVCHFEGLSYLQVRILVKLAIMRINKISSDILVIKYERPRR